MKLRILPIVMVAMCGAALAQAQVLEGNVLPMDYDGGGGRHYRTCGYYGNYTPDVPSGKKGRPRLGSTSKHDVSPRTGGGH